MKNIIVSILFLAFSCSFANESLLDSTSLKPHSSDSINYGLDSIKYQTIDSTLADSLSAETIKTDSTLKDSLLPEILNHFAIADTSLNDFNIGFFIEARFQFLNFKDRSYFQKEVDTLYYRAVRDTLNKLQEIRVSKVDFQKVNLTFPISFGLEIPLNRFFRAGLGLGFLYAEEEALLLEGSRTSDFTYGIEWWPLYYELQFNLSEWLINANDIPQIFFAIKVNQLMGSATLTYQGKDIKSNTPWAIMGWGYSAGARHSVYENLELETQLGLDYQHLDFNYRWKDLVKSETSSSFISPQMNSFWFGIRLIYLI